MKLIFEKGELFSQLEARHVARWCAPTPLIARSDVVCNWELYILRSSRRTLWSDVFSLLNPEWMSEQLHRSLRQITGMFQRVRALGKRSNPESTEKRAHQQESGIGDEFRAGDQKYVGVQADNDSPLSYQDASGAPVETHNPLGLSVGSVTILFLNLSKMVGTGIFSTRQYLCSRHRSKRKS